MAVSVALLNTMFSELPRGCHVGLVLETPEVMFAVKACADIITIGLDWQVYCQLDGWRCLMNTWKDRRAQMTSREFEEDGDDADCLGYRAAAVLEAWKVEKDAVEEWEHPTPLCLA
jgi:hypothetical protein